MPFREISANAGDWLKPPQRRHVWTALSAVDFEDHMTTGWAFQPISKACHLPRKQSGPVKMPVLEN
ncbi:hypothetical protein MPLB_20026 [Mesorhizobium sp. ORS 3324]|nr:hypothetical protein MPLB_20026 [Mesorhizobium sp. ORS 3324]